MNFLANLLLTIVVDAVKPALFYVIIVNITSLVIIMLYVSLAINSPGGEEFVQTVRFPTTKRGVWGREQPS